MNRRKDELAQSALPEVLGGVDLSDLSQYAQGFPHEVFTRLRAEAPVLLHPPGHTHDGEPFWVITRHADLVEAGTNPLFSSRGGGDREGGGTHIDDLPAGTYAGGMLNMMDDPRHRLIKNIADPAVTGAAVAAMEPALRADAARIVDEAMGECDFQADVAARFSVDAIALLLGVPEADWPKLHKWTQTSMGYEDRDSGESSDRSQQALLEMYHYGVALVAAKRAEPGTDFMTIIAHGELPEGEPPLVEYEREVFFNLLSLAGTETTRNALAVGFLALARNPDQWDALRADRSLVPGAVEEMLRWSSPTPYNRRTATEDVDFHGTTIRAGEKVTLWWASGNRDESVFTDPFVFDVRRAPNPHLAFGAGTHTCLGLELARTELRVVLEAVLDRVARVEVTGEIPWARNNKHTVALRMPVKLVPAN